MIKGLPSEKVLPAVSSDEGSNPVGPQTTRHPHLIFKVPSVTSSRLLPRHSL